MLLVGLTGGIGSGKSTVAAMLAERGAVVVDADDLARRAVETGTPGFELVREAFGDSVIRPDGSLDREALAAVVFRDAEARRALESIVHPEVARLFLEERQRHEGTGEVLVYAVPLLVENGLQGMFDLVLVVTAATGTRVAQGIEGLVHISELSGMHVESPEQVVQVGDQVQVKVIDVDVPRRRISLSVRQVGEQAPVELEIEAEPVASTTEQAEAVVPEVSEETAEVLADADARGDEASTEVMEAVVEPEPAAPEEAAMHEEPAAAAAEADEAPAEEEGDDEISLEAILRDLKRREGRE